VAGGHVLKGTGSRRAGADAVSVSSGVVYDASCAMPLNLFTPFGALKVTRGVADFGVAGLAGEVEGTASEGDARSDDSWSRVCARMGMIGKGVLREST